MFSFRYSVLIKLINFHPAFQSCDRFSRTTWKPWSKKVTITAPNSGTSGGLCWSQIISNQTHQPCFPFPLCRNVMKVLFKSASSSSLLLLLQHRMTSCLAAFIADLDSAFDAYGCTATQKLEHHICIPVW